MAESQRIAYLDAFPLCEVSKPVVSAQAHLYNLEHLIASVADLAETGEATAERLDSPLVERFARIKALLWLANEERARVEEQLLLGDNVLTAHTIYKVAA